MPVLLDGARTLEDMGMRVIKVGVEVIGHKNIP